MIFVIDDDLVMAECVAKACGKKKVKVFSNAIEAMKAIADGEMPELIFLDILLIGPDGFTFLNELVSYTDTEKIPVVIVSSLDFKQRDLSVYGVVGILDKTTMLPEEILDYVEKYCEKK
ncbi:response regulator [Candidatus Saccharibacteria bacterium]|nr:response regulator [Candidatus Saccharibacteria bacterium]